MRSGRKTLIAMGIFLASSPLSATTTDLDRCRELLTQMRIYLEGSQRFVRSWRATHPEGERWSVDGNNSSYDEFFRSVLPGGVSFERLLADRRARGQTTHVADFFGSAVFLQNPEVADSLTGVRLLPLLAGSHPEGYPNPRWRELTGDLFAMATWARLDAQMRSRGIPHFDLVVARPAGGVTMSYTPVSGAPARILEGQMRALQLLVARAYRRLNPNGGEMYLQVHRHLRETQEFQQWVEALRASGLEVSTSETSLRLSRQRGSPRELPL